MDTVASRDAALEYLAAAAIAMVHLSRLAEELVIWSTAEFGFVELADAYSTGSSLMPQKKNPDVPELVRGKSGRAIGNLVTLLTVLKGLPLTYNRDLQEDKEPLFDSVATLRDSLEVMAGTIATLEVRRDRMARPPPIRCCSRRTWRSCWCARACPSATPTRSWARSWATAPATRSTSARSPAPSCGASIRAFDAGADELLDLERSVESRSLAGGTARVRVLEALEAAEASVAAGARAARRRGAGERWEGDRAAKRRREALGGRARQGRIRATSLRARRGPTRRLPHASRDRGYTVRLRSLRPAEARPASTGSERRNEPPCRLPDERRRHRARDDDA